jgi:DNA-binding cell septation regulator SpoVG
MKMNYDDVLIKIKVIEGEKLKAIISVDFGDFVVKGFRVMASQYTNPKGDKLWLTPPSYQSAGGKWHPTFFMPDKSLWEALQAKIWDEYYKQINDHFKKRMDIGDDEMFVITKEDLPA